MLLAFIVAISPFSLETLAKDDKVIDITSLAQLPVSVGKAVRVAGRLEMRPSGYWVASGPVALQVVGTDSSLEGDKGKEVAVSGVLEKRLGSEEGNIWYILKMKSLSGDRPASTHPSTMPAPPIPRINGDKELSSLIAQKVRVIGKARNSKSGRWIECPGFSIQLHNTNDKFATWPDNIVDQAVDVTGWLEQVHVDDVPASQDPGVTEAAHIGGGDWYALRDVEWKVIKR